MIKIHLFVYDNCRKKNMELRRRRSSQATILRRRSAIMEHNSQDVIFIIQFPSKKRQAMQRAVHLSNSAMKIISVHKDKE